MKQHFANIITSLGILSGIIACILLIQGESSWIIAELFLLFSLMTDGLDGKVARKYGSTSWGPYLDDVADFINFGIHPGLWIYTILNSPILAGIYISAIGFRLVRFTLCSQNTSPFFAGLPSPAAAIAIFGILFIGGNNALFLTLGIIYISFLSVSAFPHVHVIKYKKNGILLCGIGLIGILSFFIGNNSLAVWQCLGIVFYSCVSFFLSYNSTHDR